MYKVRKMITIHVPGSGDENSLCTRLRSVGGGKAGGHIFFFCVTGLDF